jgi:mannitol 2-dehydrogenase
MVDCIVPATGEKERALVKGLGVNDAAPVTHENFRQWVIEDNFCAGRPDWDKAGATFTDHVHTYETMKIRILNGGHQVIANAAEILGVETISGCMEHPKINALFQKIAREEVAPFVEAVPDMDPLSYVDLITARFSNPKIVDTTRRVAFDGSSRHPGFILPSLRDALSKGGGYRGLALAEASWARMCEGTREDGSCIEANDPFWEDLQTRAKAAKTDPIKWLDMPHIYGDLTQEPRFVGAFVDWLSHIWEHGLMSAIDRYLDEET